MLLVVGDVEPDVVLKLLRERIESGLGGSLTSRLVVGCDLWLICGNIPRYRRALTLQLQPFPFAYSGHIGINRKVLRTWCRDKVPGATVAEDWSGVCML